MAIYKRGNGVWWVDVYVGNDHRRVRKSTGTKDKTQAKIIEQSMVAVNRGITTRQRANRILDAILPVDENALKVCDMAAFWERAMENERASISRLEWQKRRCALATFAEWCRSETRVTYAEEVTPEVACQYAAYYQQTNGVKVKTRNKVVSLLGTSWKMFIKTGKVDSSPWKFALAARNAEEEVSGRAFTDAEMERLHAVARAAGFEWDDVITVAEYTGLREADVFQLDRSEVRLDEGIIDLEPNKTKKRKVRVRIPMHPKVRAVVERQLAAEDGAHLFPFRSKHGSDLKPRFGDVRFSVLLERAGIESGSGYKISFHCLRHTFVSRLARAGVSEDVRMKLAGHTNQATHAIYQHDDTQAIAAIWRLS